MLLIRRFEERAGQLYAMGKIRGFCHLSIGREALLVGLTSVAGPDDQAITSHRCHGHALAQGCAPAAIMAELLGRSSGLNGGKGGSLHLMEPSRGFFGGHGIVGAPVSIAAGLAFANRYRSNGAVTLCTIGEGAADQGQVYEAFNLAARWALPVVFVIDNDTGRANLEQPLASRGAPFGIPGEQIDGVDLGTVRAAACKALARAREGGGPSLIEAITFPFRGHADPAAGNTDGRQRSIEEIDPVARMKVWLGANGMASEQDLKDADRDVRAAVRDAVASAQAAAEPVAAELKRHVLAPA